MIKSPGGLHAVRTAGRPAGDDLNEAELALQRFCSVLVGQASDGLLDLHLTMPQMRVLRAVERLGRASGRHLAEEFGVTPAAIVPVCDRLEAQGYLRRVRDTEDRRICWFELTDRSALMLEAVARKIRSRLRPAWSSVSRSDRETLISVLGELTAALGADGRSRATGG